MEFHGFLRNSKDFHRITWRYFLGKQNCSPFSHFGGGGGVFFGKRNAGTIFWNPLDGRILHLKAKRNFTLLVASSSDFVSAIVILNQHLDISLRHRWN